MSHFDYLEWLSLGRRVERREFMARAAALGVSTTLATTIASRGSFAGEAPKRGGHLRLGLDGSSSTDSLDPATYGVTWQYTVGYQWGNCLVELTKDAGLKPELAESWEPDATATTWVFKLRKGVEFHNGKEFTSDDVLYTVNYHRSPKSKSPAKVFFKNVKEIKATGKHEFTVTLDKPNVDFAYTFSDYHLLIMPNGGPPISGIGTGGYVIEKFAPGERAVTKRFPNYWKEDRAWVDSIETLGIDDGTARVVGLQSGSVDFINRVEPKTVNLLTRSPKLKVLNIPSAGYYDFPMLCDVPPFDSLDMRLALKYAINRKRFVKTVASGFGVVGNDNPISPLDRFYAADIPQHTYDLDKAKYHYKKTGFSGTIDLKIADAAFPGAIDGAVLFQQDAAPAGINIKVVRVADDGYWSDVWMRAGFCGSYWAGRPAPSMMLNLGYQSTATWNESHWRNKDFDNLLTQAQGELDFAKRKEMYRKLQMMITDDAGVIIPIFNNFLFGSVKNLAGLQPTPVFVGYRIGEQLYFTS